MVLKCGLFPENYLLQWYLIMKLLLQADIDCRLDYESCILVDSYFFPLCSFYLYVRSNDKHIPRAKWDSSERDDTSSRAFSVMIWPHDSSGWGEGPKSSSVQGYRIICSEISHTDRTGKRSRSSWMFLS